MQILKKQKQIIQAQKNKYCLTAIGTNPNKMNKVNIENNDTSIELDHKNTANRVSLFIVTNEGEDEGDVEKVTVKAMRINLSLDECRSLIYNLKSTMKNLVESL